MNENILIFPRPSTRRYAVVTATGKWQWAGTGREIVAQMSALEFSPPASLLIYMRRVAKRLQMGMDIVLIIEPGKYLRFLRDLEHYGLIYLLDKPA
jgi:hypothetical protein